jgi:hypothetical protein
MQNSLFRGRGGAISSCHTDEGRYLRPQWVPTFVGMAKRMIFEFLGQNRYTGFVRIQEPQQTRCRAVLQ